MMSLLEGVSAIALAVAFVSIIKSVRTRNLVEVLELELDTTLEQINTTKKSYDEALEAIGQVAVEARQAFIMSHDTRDKALPIIFAKLQIKAEGGTVH